MTFAPRQLTIGPVRSVEQLTCTLHAHASAGIVTPVRSRKLKGVGETFIAVPATRGATLWLRPPAKAFLVHSRPPISFAPRPGVRISKPAASAFDAKTAPSGLFHPDTSAVSSRIRRRRGEVRWLSAPASPFAS